MIYYEQKERNKMKHTPTVGEHLYTYTPCSNYWVSMCRQPYTVVAVKGNVITIQEARCIFYGARYFNTLADDIVEDKQGRTMQMRWSEKKQRWQQTPCGSYPKVAVFGKWDYQPYLD